MKTISSVVRTAEQLIRQRHVPKDIAVHRALDKAGYPRHDQQFRVTRGLRDDVGVRDELKSLFSIVFDQIGKKSQQLILSL